MRRLGPFAVLLLVVSFIFPASASAYSYGDPNKEDVAESFKSIALELDRSSVDWGKVKEIYKVRRSEIASHFGNGVAVTLDSNIEKKDKELLLGNFKAVLVMNLKRRFDYGKKDISDYSKSKLLLAKARGTYDVLDPYTDAKKPGASSQIYASFDAALEALGNPGLFGVGEKPADPKTYAAQVNNIYGLVKPLFPYKGATPAKKDSKPSAGQTGVVKAEDKNTTVKKPESTAAPVQNKGTVPAKPASPVQTQADPSNPSNRPEKGDSGEKTAQTGKTGSQEPVKEETAVTTENTDTENKDGEVSSSGDNEKAAEDPTTKQTMVAVEQNSESQPLAAHAPMERTTKTNAFVSILVIGLVALIGAGSLWYMKKKKLL